mmetsp:Transcript_5089/g.11479  ORF Transcript_5089/g.11479 Transcript_5089/m.11479 type:complete len:232 (+) Transcript_5089:624-1319(+)
MSGSEEGTSLIERPKMQSVAIMVTSAGPSSAAAVSSPRRASPSPSTGCAASRLAAVRPDDRADVFGSSVLLVLAAFPSSSTTRLLSTLPPSSKCRTVVSVSTLRFPSESTVVVLVTVVEMRLPFLSIAVRVEEETLLDPPPMAAHGLAGGLLLPLRPSLSSPSSRPLHGSTPCPKNPPNKLPKGFIIPAAPSNGPNCPKGSFSSMASAMAEGGGRTSFKVRTLTCVVPYEE